MNGIASAWAVYVIAATAKWEKGTPRSLPRPAVYLGSAVVFSALAVIASSEKARPAATLFGWGLVIAELVGGQVFTDVMPGASGTLKPAGVGGPTGVTTSSTTAKG